MQLFKKLNSEGTTIIQVTHSETNAAYGNRIIQLRDGWIVDSQPEVNHHDSRIVSVRTSVSDSASS